MKAEKREGRIRRSLFAARNYLTFFLLIASVVTCCFLLFMSGLDLQFEDVKKSALATFGNVLLLSLLCTLIDAMRRKITVERPMKRILQATQRLAQGDFTARIQPLHRAGRMNEFDAIIQDFNKMAQELSGIETLREDFIASVSHELRTPLAVMQNYATLLKDPALEEEKRVAYAKSIILAAQNLSELMGNILRLNKLENQQIFPQVKAYPLGEQLRTCLLGFEEAWEKKGLHLSTDIDDDVYVCADAQLLSLVWNNLCSNAIKFTQAGGSIAVDLHEKDGYVQVSVRDTGCGMTQEVGARIFEKFYQAEASRLVAGNGLGLALVKRVVDIIGGEICVSSTAGQGSVFTVKLQSGAK